MPINLVVLFIETGKAVEGNNLKWAFRSNGFIYAKFEVIYSHAWGAVNSRLNI